MTLVAALLLTGGMAAWRSGDFYALSFKSALPAAVAPNRSLAAAHLIVISLIFEHISANI
jgi:hypothetical protein